MKNTLITICARGGSKGIPGKNIKPLHGKPLIAFTIDVARRFQQKVKNTEIALSTDSKEIISVAEQFGLTSEYIRPDRLSNDTAGKVDAIKDILLFYEKKNEVKYDYVLDLDVTSPLRTLNDIITAFSVIENDSMALNLFSVSEPSRNPYFNMVEQKENGYYGKVKELNGPILSRQTAPKVYDMNASFYIYRRTFFDTAYSGAITDKSLIYLMPHICFDLDHPLDFEFISFLIANNKLDFQL